VAVRTKREELGYIYNVNARNWDISAMLMLGIGIYLQC
jgi:hypothetical protein